MKNLEGMADSSMTEVLVPSSYLVQPLDRTLSALSLWLTRNPPRPIHKRTVHFMNMGMGVQILIQL